MPGGPHWSQADLDYLAELVGDYNPAWIVKDFNRWAARHGRPQRTRTAIRHAINGKLNESVIPCGEWLGTWDIAKMVDRDQRSVSRWYRYGWICRDHVRHECNRMFICRRGLRQLARERPYVLKHLSREQLFYLLEDETVVDHVLAAACSPRRKTIPIRCVETGEEFPTMSAAAAAINAGFTTVRMAVKRGGTAKGYHFQEAA